MRRCEKSEADIFVNGTPMRLDGIPEYFLAKHMAKDWGAPVVPRGESWELLGEALVERFGAHLWHPDHWKES